VSTLVAPGFNLPSDVAVNAAAGLAYVVTSKEPALWKVDLKSKAVTRIAFGFGTSSQIVLAPEINSAYVTDRSLGNLYRVDLSTGATKVLAKGLKLPHGLAVNADRTLAYVVEVANTGSVISEINLGTGERTRAVGGSRFSSFGFLAWADTSESALYTTEGPLVAKILRMDLVALAQTEVTNFSVNCAPQCEPGLSGLAVNPSGSGIYVGRGDKVIRLPLKAPPAQRVFLSVGNVPTTSIDKDGYANTTTDPGSSFKVVDSPFGGTLDIFSNLTLLLSKNANKYKILVVGRNGSPVAPVPILASWTAKQWITPIGQLPHFEPKLVAPDSDGFYSIPSQYRKPETVPLLEPQYLMMRWPTSENGLYKLQIQILNSKGIDITKKMIPVDQQFLTVLIDNTPPVADLKTIQHGGVGVSPCEIVQTAPNSFDFGLEASDAGGHLLGYSLRAGWGRNQSETIFSETYSPLHVSPNHLWTGFTGVLPTTGWEAKCNCAHTFTLQVSKRTINGYNYILSSSSYESITINNTGNSCP
jgi:DNA-binding beta-propeller fold protein YncE